MKAKRTSVVTCLMAAAALHLANSGAQAQTSVLINAFNDSSELSVWANWFGTAYYQALWDSSDANQNANSGSMMLEAFYADSGLGGCCGPQFVLFDGNNGINPPLVGNGGPPAAALATNVEFDVRFDPVTFAVNENWPAIEVGTRGVDFGQHTFGTFTIAATQTNWVHEVIPIAASANWTNIPNIYFKYYSSSASGWLRMFIDNIRFTTASIPIVPPTMALEKPVPALRVFAGSVANTYDREQLTTVDTNQSWVGGTYPVSYSFKLLSFPAPPTNQTALFRFHIFLVPLRDIPNNFVNNEYLEYQVSNNFWLNITTTNPAFVRAEVAWKTNLPDANPDQIALTVSNPTAVGTWTLTFSSATEGTLTAPGATPQAFSLPADAAAQFANPLIAQFGVQPDSAWGEGEWADVAQIQTSGVASPGVPINTVFSTATSLDTNIWNPANSAQPSSLVLATSNASWWVNWTYPDYTAVLGTKADLASALPWKTPLYYTGYVTNSFFQAKMGGKVWALIPAQGLPTADGLSNGVPATKAFFRLSLPGPAE